MARYVVTPAADTDLNEIWQYVFGESGQRRADALELQLHKDMQRIGRHPGIGHVREDLADEHLRVWSTHRFLIVYRPQTRPVQIIRVLHGARDIAALMRNHSPPDSL